MMVLFGNLEISTFDNYNLNQQITTLKKELQVTKMREHPEHAYVSKTKHVLNRLNGLGVVQAWICFYQGDVL